VAERKFFVVASKEIHTAQQERTYSKTTGPSNKNKEEKKANFAFNQLDCFIYLLLSIKQKAIVHIFVYIYFTV
jgi:hypothetical protein